MSNTTSYSVPLPTLLFITFIVLKLTHVVNWPWLWVFAPLWVPLAVAGGFFIAYLLFCLAVFLLADISSRKVK